MCIVAHDRSLWTPLEAFFLLKGYRLFVYESPEYDVPADRNEIRAEDPYHVFIWKRVPSRFYCPVRAQLVVSRNVARIDADAYHNIGIILTLRGTSYVELLDCQMARMSYSNYWQSAKMVKKKSEFRKGFTKIRYPPPIAIELCRCWK